MAKIYLGTIRGTKLFIEKHKWDCSWYWAFGYIGNRDLHTHFDNVFLKERITWDVTTFDDCNFRQGDWWVILELFKQAYALKEAAAVYKHGGWVANRVGITDTTKSKAKMETLNEDLKKTLDILWEFMDSNRLNREVEDGTGSN